MATDIRFKHPFTCIIGGPTGSGKSTFCIRFLQNLDTLCTEPDFPGGIVWCYSEQSAVPRQRLTALRKKYRFERVYPKILKTPKVYHASLFFTTF
jgi:ABC-type phosphate transport system ATPase subunit